jgi:uncharacterized membrane protein YhfC
MQITILFALEGVIVVCGVAGLAWWLRRRLGARWNTWTWGALAFGGAYLVQIPVLLVLMPLLSGEGTRPEWQSLAGTLLLVLTAALIGETVRYVALRWLPRDRRNFPAALMFGAGYGGMEAILLIVPGVVASLQLLLNGDALLAQAQSIAPDQAAELAAQLDSLRNTPWWLPVLSVWGCVASISFHTAASVLIWRALNGAAGTAVQWWGLAVLYHLAYAAVSMVMQSVGPGAPELALTGFLISSVYVIRRFRVQ